MIKQSIERLRFKGNLPHVVGAGGAGLGDGGDGLGDGLGDGGDGEGGGDDPQALGAAETSPFINFQSNLKRFKKR